MKILLFLLLYAPLFANNFNKQYEILQGAWVSPQLGELTAYFIFDNQGKFTTSLVPDFEYESLSGDRQEQIIRENMTDNTGYFSLINVNSSTADKFSAKAEIYLNEEYSTNNIEVSRKEILIINPDGSKVIFAEKQE